MIRMLGNALVDALIGAIPVAGAVGDIFFRANTRNLALLDRHSRPGVRPTQSDYAFVLAIAGVFGLLVLIPVVIALWLTIQLWTVFAR